MRLPSPRASLFWPQIRLGLWTLVALFFLGTIGFKLAGGETWTTLDAVFMTVITISTVGYEEVHPLTPAGKIVAMALILGGVGTLVYVSGKIAEGVVNGRVFWRRRVAARVNRMQDHVIVCGYGRVGQSIVRTLRGQGLPYVAISLEQPEEEDDGVPVIVGDATDEDVLRRAGIDRARALIAVLGNDAANIFAILTARSLRQDLYILSRCSETRSASKMIAAGAQRVLNPYERGGQMMAHIVLRPQLSDFMEDLFARELEVNVEEVAIAEGSPLAGQTLRESPIRRELDIIVAVIVTSEGTKLFNPSPDATLVAGETLIVLGRPAALDRLRLLARG
ncbi:MAG: potassium channel protein [Candidatus Polarisedimenticolia bacterium]